MSYLTSNPGLMMRVLNSSAAASGARACACSTPSCRQTGRIEQPDLREHRCLVPVDVLAVNKAVTHADHCHGRQSTRRADLAKSAATAGSDAQTNATELHL